MAIARGAGTEIIRSVLLEDVNATGRNMIVGVQHHIYTVLSIIVHARALNADRDFINCSIYGYDAVIGETQEWITLFKQDMSLDETYVWNDKFSFNGHEAVDFTGPLSADAAGIVMQDAIADQGGSAIQVLSINGEHASDGFDIACTYIDQNNA